MATVSRMGHVALLVEKSCHHLRYQNIRICLCRGVAGLLVLFALTSVSSLTFAKFSNSNIRNKAASVAAKATPTMSSQTFSLLVTLIFTDDVHKKSFLRDIAPLAQYVKDYELETIAYEVLLSDKDPLRVVILERYRNKDNAFLKIHRNSKQFLEFRPKLQAMQEAGHVSVDGESYMDAGIGFGDRVV